MDVLPVLLLFAFMAGIMFAYMLNTCLATCLGPRQGARKTTFSSMSRKPSQLGEAGSAGSLSTPMSSQCLRDEPNLGLIFLNPSASTFHLKGCFHIGSHAKAICACKHCMPAVKLNKED